MANNDQNNAQNYFENLQKTFSQNAQAADLNKATAAFQSIAQKSAEAAVAASKAWYQSVQSIAKSQADFYQKQAEQFQAAAGKAFSGGKPEDSIENSAKLAQKSIDANLKNSQEVAKSASETAVEVFDILNKQAVKNMNEISSMAKQAS